MDNKKLLGQRIKEIRKLKGLTQEKLAENIGLETGSLSAIESGRHFPSIITLEKIACHLDVQINYFFEFNKFLSDQELLERTINNLISLPHNDLYRFYLATEILKTSK